MSIETMVICSTLNQIINYLIIEKYKPQNVYNITFTESAMEKLNMNIRIKEWDKQLKETCEKSHRDINFIPIKLDILDTYERENTRKEIEGKMDLDKIKSPIYWHITGGQRTIALAIDDLIRKKGRKEDRLIYVEGNTENLIISDYKGNLISKGEKYNCVKLTLKEALKLVGFKNTIKPSNIFEIGDKLNNEEKGEYEFYRNLYNEFIKESTKIEYRVEYKNEEHKGSIRELLLESNRISKEPEERRDFVKKIFDQYLEKNPKLEKLEYKINESREIRQGYPAGYIFEKIAAYKIYDVIKNSSAVNEMATSLKTYFDSDDEVNGMIDELDIVLLTDTGKLINFECKAGGMKGDNAKSHSYTTYRLSGVFGTPIILSPLLKDEKEILTINEDKNLENQRQALRAAKSAEIEVWCIDEIKDKLEKLLDID